MRGVHMAIHTFIMCVRRVCMRTVLFAASVEGGSKLALEQLVASTRAHQKDPRGEVRAFADASEFLWCPNKASCTLAGEYVLCV